jgi:hypothetical protein
MSHVAAFVTLAEDQRQQYLSGVRRWDGLIGLRILGSSHPHQFCLRIKISSHNSVSTSGLFEGSASLHGT